MASKVSNVVALAIILGVALYAGYGGVDSARGYLTHTDDVETTRGTVVEGAREVDGLLSGGRWQRVAVTYRYTVDGRTYERSRVFASGRDDFTVVENHERFVRRHPENASIRVYYDPSRPGEAFVRYDPLLLIVVRVVVLVGVSLAVLGVFGHEAYTSLRGEES